MSKRPKCANCTMPYTPGGIGKNQAITSFCTLACGAEFAERVLRSEPAVATLLVANDPMATRLQLATGCGKLVWAWAEVRWIACPNGKECTVHHGLTSTPSGGSPLP